MKKRIASLILAVLIAAVILPTQGFANESEPSEAQDSGSLPDNSSVTLDEESASDGNDDPVRLDPFGLADETVTFQTYLITGAEAQNAVTLTAPEIGYAEPISAHKYTVVYKWYTCSDENGRLPRRISGAPGNTLAVFPDSGLQYYICKAFYCRVYSLIRLKTNKVCRTVYTVGVSPLPTVYVNTESGAAIASRDEWESAEMSIVGCEDESFDLCASHITIKGRGNSSWLGSGDRKNSYTIKFDSKKNLFNIGDSKKWVLQANYYDKSLLRNWLADELDRSVYDYGNFDIVQIPVDLILNGEYAGNYYLCSAINIGSSRVNVPNILDGPQSDVNGDGVIDLYDTGFLIEIDARKGASHYYKSRYTNAWYCLFDPDLDESSPDSYMIFRHIYNVINEAEGVLYSDDFADPETGYAKYIDVDSVIDYLLIQSIAKNNDSIWYLSIHFYYDPADGLLHMAPVWDFDIAFGNVNYNDCDKYEGYIHDKYGWFARLLTDPSFVLRLTERWDDTKEQVRDLIGSELPAQADLIRISAEMNFARWKELGEFIWPDPDGYEDRTTYQSEVDYLVDWVNNRIDWLDGYYADLAESALTALGAAQPDD